MSPIITDQKCDVFISYARADYKDENNNPIPDNVISKIGSAFRKNNISYWIDEKGIHTGDDYSSIIAKAIQNSSVFVFVSTKNSNSSRWVQGEIRLANTYKKPILPIKCDDSEYAHNVILDLITLDYCDYYNFPDSAINKLVESVKEKLPESKTTNENNKSKGDSTYKEHIEKSLDQIVSLSQYAVSRILDSNERKMMELRDLADSRIDHLCETEKKYFESLENSILSHLNEINKTTKDELRGIVSCVQKLSKDLELSHNEHLEQQKKTNFLLERLTAIYFQSSFKKYKSEKELIHDDNVPHVSQKKLADLFFVIDVSGSMAGDRITGLNNAMRSFISNFNNIHPIIEEAEVALSVLSYSSNSQWQYEDMININDYKWRDLEASGTTNLGNALKDLDCELENYSDSDISPLIVFITDGTPTDSFEKDYSTLKSKPGFLSSKCFCISIGPDARNVIEKATEFRVSDTSNLTNVLDQILRIYLDQSMIAQHYN